MSCRSKIENDQFKVPSKSLEFLSSDRSNENHQDNQFSFKENGQNFTAFGSSKSKEKFNNASADNILISSCSNNTTNTQSNTHQPYYYDSENNDPYQQFVTLKNRHYKPLPIDFQSNMNITQSSPFRTPTMARSQILSASHNFILSPQNQPVAITTYHEKDQTWQRILFSLIFASVAGLITILMVYFLADVKKLSTLFVLFFTLTMFLFLVLNISSSKKMFGKMFQFLASVQGTVCILLLVLALLTIGPADYLVSRLSQNQGEVAKTDLNYTNEGYNEFEMAMLKAHQYNMNRQLDQSEEQFKTNLNQAIGDLELENKFIARDFSMFVDQCSFVAEHIITVSAQFDQNSQCPKNEEKQNANANRETSLENNNYRQSETKNLENLNNNDGTWNDGNKNELNPIWAIIHQGNLEIQRHQNAVAKPWTSEQTQPDPKTCPCCSQLISPFQKFCLYLSRQSPKFNMTNAIQNVKKVEFSKQFEDVKHNFVNIYPKKTSQNAPLQNPRKPQQSHKSSSKRSGRIALSFSAILFSLASVVIVIFHSFSRTSREVDSNLKMNIFVSFILILIMFQFNSLATFGLFFIESSSFYKSEQINNYIFSSEEIQIMIPIFISWALNLIQFSIMIAKVVKESWKDYEISAIRNNLTNYCEENKFNNNVPNALNFNITYPNSPKVSKSMNVSGKDFSTHQLDRSMTLPISSSYV